MFAFPPVPLRLAGVGSLAAVEEDARLSPEKRGQQSALMTSSDSESCTNLQISVTASLHGAHGASQAEWGTSPWVTHPAPPSITPLFSSLQRENNSQPFIAYCP